MAVQLKALIDEANCIGCGKCVRICPTDAIVGAKHTLHTIIPQFCTSCENCINVCPTDCIELKTQGEVMPLEYETLLTQKKQQRLFSFKPSHMNIMAPVVEQSKEEAKAIEVTSRKQQVNDAIARARLKRESRNL